MIFLFSLILSSSALATEILLQMLLNFSSYTRFSFPIFEIGDIIPLFTYFIIIITFHLFFFLVFHSLLFFFVSVFHFASFMFCVFFFVFCFFGGGGSF